ncbi:PEP-CTERM sorting domain-containing protein [Pontiellaceae bacterium B12219]|nr:PEP-CTERM sorting domain-containing protein [Pontiellaceae bacterium B12219]
MTLQFTTYTTDDVLRLDTFTVAAVPEPATLGLIGACAIGAFAVRRFRI